MTSRIPTLLALAAVTVFLISVGSLAAAVAQAQAQATAEQVAANTASIEFIRQLPQILVSLGTFAGVIITGFIAWSGAQKSKKALENQERAESKRTTMDSKLDVLHKTTNGVAEAAREASLQKGILIGMERERERVILEEAALAKGRIQGANDERRHLADLAAVPPSAQAAAVLAENAAKAAALLEEKARAAAETLAKLTDRSAEASASNIKAAEIQADAAELQAGAAAAQVAAANTQASRL